MNDFTRFDWLQFCRNGIIESNIECFRPVSFVFKITFVVFGRKKEKKEHIKTVDKHKQQPFCPSGFCTLLGRNEQKISDEKWCQERGTNEHRKTCRSFLFLFKFFVSVFSWELFKKENKNIHVLSLFCSFPSPTKHLVPDGRNDALFFLPHIHTYNTIPHSKIFLNMSLRPASLSSLFPQFFMIIELGQFWEYVYVVLWMAETDATGVHPLCPCQSIISVETLSSPASLNWSAGFVSDRQTKLKKEEEIASSFN